MVPFGIGSFSSAPFVKKRSIRPSLSKSKIATPPPIVSSKYFRDVGEPACLKAIFIAAVMSVKVTVDGPFGPGGGGVFGNSSVLYERPVRGVGEGVGCCALTL